VNFKNILQPSKPDNGNANLDSSSKPVDLDRLFSTFGEKLIADLLTDYVIEADERMKQLASAIDDKDIHAINQFVHDLKGSSATIYATELAELSTSMELFVRREDYSWDEMSSRFNQLNEAWDRVREYLTAVGYCQPKQP
jgi:HPt (histidine-containing phosphotransfer) domain-containing protein